MGDYIELSFFGGIARPAWADNSNSTGTNPDGRMDVWFEEDDEVFVHARDPYHRIDVLNSSRRGTGGSRRSGRCG